MGGGKVDNQNRTHYKLISAILIRAMTKQKKEFFMSQKLYVAQTFLTHVITPALGSLQLTYYTLNPLPK